MRARSVILGFVLIVAALVGAVLGSSNAASAEPVFMETVPVGDVGNEPDFSYGQIWFPPAVPRGEGFGGVDYAYNIGRYEVTAGQYTAFLNAVAGVDANNLYFSGMANTQTGCGILRSGAGTSGNPYTYSVAPDFANRPVVYVSFWSACRFANWLHHGQPTGEQNGGTTEDGAYTLTASGIAQNTVVRNSGATWVVPNKDEWYKAAYYKAGGAAGGGVNPHWWLYATQSDTAPGRDMADVSGNNANYLISAGASPYPIDSGKYTTPVGQFKNSPGPYGTFDMNGNVEEMTETITPWLSFARFNWGGRYDSIPFNLEPHDWRNPGVTLKSAVIGFRVVQIPGSGMNLHPTVAITSPADGATFSASASIAIQVSAGDPDGSIAKVAFYQGVTKLGETSAAPYQYLWSNVGPGNYTLMAKAYDNQGARTLSYPVDVAVLEYEAAVPLAAGYTLIALPLIPTAPLTAEGLGQQINAQASSPICTSVIGYRDGTFVTHPVGTAVNNFTLDVGKGYFVRCVAAGAWRARGCRFVASSATVTLTSGYELIGLPLETDPAGKYTAESAGQEINAQGGGATQLIDYDAATGQFVTHPVGTAVSNFMLGLGRGYFIRCAKGSVWTVSR